ncbi:PepSY-associated TM helix domain-containing protein [Kineosporia succinea]|uniref:Iron-regulated membrane protein n=1 Tax=Kineosporia succinea TaxID=84632 RepID=A0ABT9P9I1_9ACTN|nr:PepSY-associated TM helix domain-containing protein [Kineosporia succinea]MDP9828825.1 putative iron-regulated membrane protein [Kineosporia succinea]
MTLPADRTHDASLILRADEVSVAATRPWRPLLLRLHFYAGVFVAPFLVVAALTGLGYVFSPQLEGVVHGEELRVDPGGRVALPVAEQVAAARAAHPEGTVVQIVPGDAPRDTTQVTFAVGGLENDRQHTVYVDPYTAGVTGELTTWAGYTPVRSWLDDLHRNLLLGDWGRWYSETAASWLWVMVLGGLVLWWQRLRPRPGFLRRALTPDLAARRGVRRTRSWHASLGVWLAVGLLFLSVTGLTWSRWAGGHFGDALTALDSRTPQLPTVTQHSEHTAHTGVGHALEEVDAVIAEAAAAGLENSIRLTPPAGAGEGWTVIEKDRSVPVHLDRAVIDGTGNTVTVSRFGDWPLLAQLTTLGVAAHMGLLFGLVNQVLLAGLAVGLVCVIVWGYRMWWQRRPTGTRLAVGPAPRSAGWRPVPIIAALVVGWVMPTIGVGVLLFLMVDVVVVRVRRETGRVPGEGAGPRPSSAGGTRARVVRGVRPRRVRPARSSRPGA